jgi:hypothetical protein
MKQTIAKSLVLLGFACLSIQLAHACYICGYGGVEDTRIVP